MNNSLISQSTQSNVLERIRYYPRQLITADDMRAEQDYFRDKLRQHNRYLHGWGVVCGCKVTAPQDGDPPWQVTVQGGYVITPCGDEILIPGPISFDLAGDWRQPYDVCPAPTPCHPASGTPGGGQTVYLAVCYSECSGRPVRIHPAGCGCDDAACEYSRIREIFELVRLDQLPESHTQAEASDTAWQNWLKLPASDRSAAPLPDCPDVSDDCVVLARINLPENRTIRIKPNNIVYNNNRRVLLSTSVLQLAALEVAWPTPTP